MPEVVLRDTSSGAEARILPEIGFNCIAFQAVVGGRTFPVIDTLPGFENGSLSPAGSGIPLLFPFPNRIRNGRFAWEGRTYELPPNLGPNAIHGLVFDRPWRTTAADERTVIGEFQLSVDAPDRRPLWPADFLIEVRYALYGQTLRADVRIVNADRVALPWGFGTHPYFTAPLASDSRPSDCLVQLPCAERWELIDCLPTGARRPVSDENDLREGASLDRLRLDDVYTQAAAAPTPPHNFPVVRSLVMDARAGVQVEQRAPAEFREWVVYTPPNRRAVCIEPYTCVTDAVNLQTRGIDAGWQILPPGGEHRTWVEIEAGLILV